MLPKKSTNEEKGSKYLPGSEIVDVQWTGFDVTAFLDEVLPIMYPLEPSIDTKVCLV